MPGLAGTPRIGSACGTAPVRQARPCRLRRPRTGPRGGDAARGRGHRILRLNLGNPAPFGFDAPDEIVADMARSLATAQGYSDSKGILSARRAVVQYQQSKGLVDIDVEDVWLGNGVSELIT